MPRATNPSRFRTARTCNPGRRCRKATGSSTNMTGKSKPLAFLLLMASAASAQPRQFLTLANGQRFFPVGLYGFPQNRSDDAIYREARQAGFNFLVGHE